jgi:hypothetical protein
LCTILVTLCAVSTVNAEVSYTVETRKLDSSVPGTGETYANNLKQKILNSP